MFEVYSSFLFSTLLQKTYIDMHALIIIHRLWTPKLTCRFQKCVSLHWCNSNNAKGIVGRVYDLTHTAVKPPLKGHSE